MLGSLFGGKKNKEQAPAPEELKNKRLHVRYSFDQLQSAFVVFDNGLRGKIKDLSYSGFAVQFENPEDGARAPKDAELNMSILGESTPAAASRVYTSKSLCGYYFQHRDPTALIFLRRILEFLRCGASLVVLDKSVVNDRFKDGNWIVMRGDGPTDLTINIGNESGTATPKTALLTFLDGKDYSQLRYGENSFMTGRTLEKSDIGIAGIGQGMGETTELDVSTIRKSIYILVAIDDRRIREVVLPVVSKARSVFPEEVP